MPIETEPAADDLEHIVSVAEKLAPTAPLERDQSLFFPKTGAEAEWNAAYYRLEDYFRSLHLYNKIHQSQLILRLLRTASEKHRLNPELNLTTLAMEETYSGMDTWFEDVLQAEDKFSHQGRLSLFITDAMEKHPSVFLSEDVPADYERALRQCRVQAGPDLQFSSMVPRPLDDSPLVEIELPESWKRGLSFLTVFAIAAFLTAFFLIFMG